MDYEMLSGEIVDLDPSRAEAARFFRRVKATVDDAIVTFADVDALVYGLDNPLLDKTVIPGRATITRAVFADPYWHALCDLIDRKRVMLSALDMDKVRAKYTLTATQAAERAGVHVSAIRQAIAAKRLTAFKDGNRWLLDPREVANYSPGAQGPSPALKILVGSAPGASFRVKHQGGEWENGAKSGQTRAATISDWDRVAVIAGTKTEATTWILEPGSALNEIAFAGFFVRGRFKIVREEQREAPARELFQGFRSSRGSARP